MHHSNSPVRWGRFPGLTGMLARALSPAEPPVLVVSLPRSGSSWVGEVLGAAPDAMYLREPWFAEQSLSTTRPESRLPTPSCSVDTDTAQQTLRRYLEIAVTSHATNEEKNEEQRHGPRTIANSTIDPRRRRYSP